jgi:hypothetical protein
MAANWPKLPAFNSPDELDTPIPYGWRFEQIENLFEQLPIGKRFEKKTCQVVGLIPVIDQSEFGVIGWHNEQPGVQASINRPVVTFANHTCEMRWMLKPFSVIQNVFPLIGKDNVCDSRFLYYGTKGRVNLEEYKGHFPDYRRKWIPLPPLPEQRAIAHILGSLDDKIELNRRMNATLEAMAQALFQSWFVDFDPVIDKALAAGNPIPEPLHQRAHLRCELGEKRKPLPADVARNFPDRFVFTAELGWVPEGWEVSTVGGLIDLRYGKALPASHRKDGHVPVFGSGGVSGYHNTALVKGPGIVVGRKGTVGSLHWVDEDFFPIDTVFYVANKSQASLIWLFQCLRLIDIKSMGADSAVPGVNRNAIYSTFLCMAESEILKEYARTAEQFFDRQRSLTIENRALTEIRDTLLPKLLSGGLRVPDAERLVAGAL